MQDLLDLDAEARMNFPGTMSNSNWTWRANNDIITDDLARKLRALTALYGRLGAQIGTDSQGMLFK